MIQLSTRISTLLLARGLVTVLAGYASAQAATFWNYEGTGTSIIAPNVTGADNPSITDSHYAEIGGTNMTDAQVTRWQTLLTSGYAWGSTTPLVRGRDITEDWQVNWSTPGTEAVPGTSSRFVTIDIGASSATWAFLGAGGSGPHANELFRGNANLIAVGDEAALFWDTDQTLSYYGLGGGLIADYSWTTLTGTGGTLVGSSLNSILANSFIGTEQGQLAFLVGPDTVEFYQLSTGQYLRSADYSNVTTGPLGDATLADIIDGKTPYTYLGIDGVTPGPLIGTFAIPEPSAAILGGLGALVLFRRRRC